MFESEYKEACQRWNVLANKPRTEEEEAEFQKIDRETEAYRYAKERPFYCLTRDYNAKGDKDVRTFRFKTRAAQLSFMQRTARCVTAYN